MSEQYDENFVGDMSYEDGNGRPNFANSWRLDSEGTHTYRILPPVGALAKTQKWAYYEAIHWGFVRH
jgi:hypothetical protein